MAKVKSADELSNRGLASRVLGQINAIRRALAIGEKKLDRLPKGKISNTDECVLARALSNGWKAQVGTSSTRLIHPVEGVDWEAAREALATLGFQAVVRPAVRTHFNEQCKQLHFSNTEEMSELVMRFDNGDLEHLILND